MNSFQNRVIVKGMKVTMTKRWLSGIVALLLLVGLAGAAFALEPFKVDRYVTDRAGLLAETENQQLAELLDQYARDTGNQLLVVTVPSLENRETAEFTEALFKLNQPGQKGKDNGVILLVAKAEHKIRIEVGYGLEGVLPDGKAGTIIREVISPYFKAGDYYNGIVAGVSAMITAITPDYQLGNVPEAQPAPRRRSGGLSPLAVLVFVLIAIFSSIFNRFDRFNTRRRYRGGYSEPGLWGGGSSFGNDSSSGYGGSGGFDGGGGGFGGGGAGGDW
jgi:uncharacterized protein